MAIFEKVCPNPILIEWIKTKFLPSAKPHNPNKNVDFLANFYPIQDYEYKEHTSGYLLDQ
jgi:hypothetical protein